MSDTILDIQHLSIDLPPWADRPQAVSDASLTLRRDEILCVVGETGSGKSMMARAVMGLLPPPHVRASAGSILLEGEDILKVSAARMREIRCNRVSMVFQEPMTAFNPVKTIGSQVDEVLELHTALSARERTERVAAMLEAVSLADPQRVMRSYPHQISGGQRQRAMIAMALILEPSVVIADEPTTALDVTTQAQILELIREKQAAHHIGILFITHDFGIVADIADRIAVMQHGKIVEIGDADQILNAPQHPYTRSLISAVPDIVPHGKAFDKDAPVVMTANNVNKTYRVGGGFFGQGARVVPAVRSVNLSLRRGETLGLVGESGSGKSTLARCLTRLIGIDSGTVLIDGTDIMKLSGKGLRAHRKHIQMVFQDPYGSLDPRYRAGKLIAEGPIVHGVPEEEAYARTYALLEMVGLDRRAAERYPHEFSGGQRQRIGIARALALEPAVLVADEAVSALDVSVQAQVLKLLADIRDRLNLAMLFITHDLRVAAQVCDSIAVMRYGEIVEYGATAQVYAKPEHPYTKALFSAIPGRNWRPPASDLSTEGSPS